jgi:hypothetical protein
MLSSCRASDELVGRLVREEPFRSEEALVRAAAREAVEAVGLVIARESGQLEWSKCGMKAVQHRSEG